MGNFGQLPDDVRSELLQQNPLAKLALSHTSMYQMNVMISGALSHLEEIRTKRLGMPWCNQQILS